MNLLTQVIPESPKKKKKTREAPPLKSLTAIRIAKFTPGTN